MEWMGGGEGMGMEFVVVGAVGGCGWEKNGRGRGFGGMFYS